MCVRGFFFFFCQLRESRGKEKKHAQAVKLYRLLDYIMDARCRSAGERCLSLCVCKMKKGIGKLYVLPKCTYVRGVCVLAEQRTHTHTALVR